MGSGDSAFDLYWIFLIASGILMLVMAGTGFGKLSAGERAINGVFGLAFLGYGLYLGFIFDGGHYLIFFKAFIVPVVLVISAIRHAVANRKTKSAQPNMYAQQPYPQQPYGQGQAQYGQQPFPQPPTGQPGQPFPQQPFPHPAQAYLRPPSQTAPNQPPVAVPYQSPIQPG